MYFSRTVSLVPVDPEDTSLRSIEASGDAPHAGHSDTSQMPLIFNTTAESNQNPASRFVATKVKRLEQGAARSALCVSSSPSVSTLIDSKVRLYTTLY
jgi:hypothetical protein